MGWLVALAGIVLLVLITSKTVDRETTRNFKHLGKIVVVVIGAIVIFGFLYFISR